MSATPLKSGVFLNRLISIVSSIASLAEIVRSSDWPATLNVGVLAAQIEEKLLESGFIYCQSGIRW